MIKVRIVVFCLAILLVVLFIAAFLVPHISSFPILNNLLRDPNVLPFLITAMVDVFLMHLLISLCTIKTMHQRKWLQVLLMFGTYAAIFVSLFVFAFVTTTADYAVYLIVCFNIAWMINTVRFSNRLFAWNVSACVVYTLSSFVYFVLYTFYPQQLSGILAVEIASGLSFVFFLLTVSADFAQFKIEIDAEGRN